VKKFHAGVKNEDKDKGIRGFGDLKEELWRKRVKRLATEKRTSSMNTRDLASYYCQSSQSRCSKASWGQF
jgi:hypothetical protein